MADKTEKGNGDTAKIEAAFPATDPIAQFVVVILGQRDDLAETATQVVKRAQSDDRTVHYYHRLLVSHYFEAMKWFAHATKHSREVANWLDEFSEPEQKAAIDAAIASTKPGGLAKAMLWAGRQTTFHYPRVDVEDDGLREALEAIGEVEVEMHMEKREHGWYPRAAFVEELFTYRLLHTFGDDVKRRMEEVRDAAIQYVQLADACLSRYMSERDLQFREPIFQD